MKKKLTHILFLLISLFFVSMKVNADCYKKCTLPMAPGTECSYVKECTPSGSFSCVLTSVSYCELPDKVSCGNVTEIPTKIPELTSYCITLVQIAVPIILIIMGTLDLFKGVTAQKEDEIKKGQQMLIKRLITAVIIFFVIVITKFLISVVADATSSANITECIDCFLSGVENCRR